MVKILCTVMLSMMVGRWMYAETELIAPNAMPIVDALIDHASIPTHDQWPRDSIQVFYKRLARAYQAAQHAFVTQDQQASAAPETVENAES